MGLDPITLEVLRNKFDVIADEMELALLRSSFSPIVKEGLDASAALFTVEGEVVAQAAAIPIHLGCLVPTVQRIIQAFPIAAMEEGDAYIMNDPYDGGTHLPDTTIVQPILFQGRTVALAASMTHNQDIGGKSPGSVPTDSTDIFQEGLCIPPLKFYERGKPNQTLHDVMKKNVRLPDVFMGDLHGQIAANTVGIQRFNAVLEEYGLETVRQAIAELMDRAEAMTRAGISKIPDGSYTFTDFLDNDGVVLDKPVKIQARVTVKGEEIHFDLTGSSPQTKGPVNSVASATVSAAYYVLRTITDPAIPNNSGCYRPLHFTLPDGSVVNPRYPAPVNARTVTVVRVADALMGALVQAIPERIIAADSGQLNIAFGGFNPKTGKSFVTTELGTGGVGARPTKDGIDVLDFGPVNCMNIPSEATELNSPLRVRRFNLRTDSGGAGRYRGGLGYHKVFEAVQSEIVVSLRGERFFTQPWGLFGGEAGGAARAWIENGDGTTDEILSKRVFTLYPGQRLHIHTPGGGGYGDPLTRDPERVRQDVLDRKVSPERAQETYGVVLSGPSLSVDGEATRQLRAALRVRGGAVTWTFGHGPRGTSQNGEIGMG
jgi:N-methylhydantoinase B